MPLNKETKPKIQSLSRSIDMRGNVDIVNRLRTYIANRRDVKKIVRGSTEKFLC